MNKKVISTAVACALAVPAVASAQDNGMTVQVYGRINNALSYISPGDGDSEWGLHNTSSRLGVKASSDLGNGLTAIGRYEFFTFTNREGNNCDPGNCRGGIQDTRLGYVGLSGAWGAVTIGNQWSAYYDTVGTYLDPTYSLGYYIYSSVAQGPYRSSNTIKYANSFGPAYIELDVRTAFNNPGADTEKIGNDSGDSDDIDGVGLGVNFAIGEAFSLAAAYDSNKRAVVDNQDRWGIAGKFNAAGWWASLGYQEIDANNPPGRGDIDGGKTQSIAAYVGGVFGRTSVVLGYQQADVNGADSDPNQWTLGVYHNMGGGFRLYYEGTNVDNKDTGIGFDGNRHLLGMRFDFST